MAQAEKFDIVTCDKDPIHSIGAVQEHGFFLAFRFMDKTIYHASKNSADFIGKPINEIISRPLASVLGEEAARRVLLSASNLVPGDFEVVRIPSLGTSATAYQILVFELNGLIALEFEKRHQDSTDEAAEISKSHKRSCAFVEQLHSSDDLITAAGLVCRAVRSMLGFDRVMMYRYLPRWDGEVIAEDKSSEAHSFLAHRFPATDIPLPARELYLKNRTRQIVDSSTMASPIVPGKHYLTQKPIDLTHSKLRAVAPIHLTYLKNMGVKASFSIAVIVDGQLWGLVACHGNAPTVISHETRLACETVVATFAIIAKMMENLSKRSIQVDFEEKLRSIFQKIRLSESPLSALLVHEASICTAFSATGIAIASRSKAEVGGMAPPEQTTMELAQWLRARFRTESKKVIAIESLAKEDARWQPLAELACGVLAVCSGEADESMLLIFRPELVKSITWGGDPRKAMQKRNYEGMLNPRLSFESWNETVSGYSKKWEQYEIEGATFLRDFLFDSLLSRDRLIRELGSQLNTNN